MVRRRSAAAQKLEPLGTPEGHEPIDDAVAKLRDKSR